MKKGNVLEIKDLSVDFMTVSIAMPSLTLSEARR